MAAEKLTLLGLFALLFIIPAYAANTCFDSVQSIPANCTGGTITQDTTLSNGCRSVVCTSSTGGLQILACDKPGSYNPQYFEMYKQTWAGTVPRVCIGQACIQDNGFAKSTNYPICSGTNQTITNVSISIAPWFPQGNNYVFVCNAQGVTPTSYDWNFGDGQNLYDLKTSDVYHTYQSNGTYTVACTPSDHGVPIATGLFAVTVGNVTPPPNQTNQTPPANQTNQTNTTNQTNQTNTTCFNSVANIPASCTGGTITSDTYNGCRTIVCANGTSNLQALACDKTNPSRFELYKQSQTGAAIQSICLGKTCITNNGFASATYPYCIAGSNQTSNQTNASAQTHYIYYSEVARYTPPGPSFSATDEEKSTAPVMLLNNNSLYFDDYDVRHEVVRARVFFTFGEATTADTILSNQWTNLDTNTTTPVRFVIVSAGKSNGAVTAWLGKPEFGEGEIDRPGHYSVTFTIDRQDKDEPVEQRVMNFTVLPGSTPS